MVGLRRVVMVLIGLLTCAFSAEGARAAGPDRLALVIGNSAYAHTSPLANPEKDARLIAEALGKDGFNVFLHSNVSQRDMKRALRDFTASLRAAGNDAVGLIYFAGHGTQVDGRNYLLPVDANIENEADVPIESLALDDMLAQLEGTNSAVNIVILDACRNNPYQRGHRAAVRGLAPIRAVKGTLVAYSTAPGTTAEDGDGDNSPYAAALARNLSKPGLSIEKLFKNIRVEVDKATQGNQTPWEESSLFGDFFFLQATAGGGGAIADGGNALKSNGRRSDAYLVAETAFWNTVKDSDNPSAVQSYLSTFPEGFFAPIARLRIEELKQQHHKGIADNKRKQVAVLSKKARAPKQAPRPTSSTEDCLEFFRDDGTDLYCASSTLKPQKDNFYGIASLLDDNNYTAWFEGRKDEGVGEWISVDFGELRRVDRLLVKNGYNKRKDLYYKNCRVGSLQLIFSGGERRDVSLKDEPGEQVIEIQNPPQARWVQIKIASVVRGSKYKDTGLNELRVATSAPH